MKEAAVFGRERKVVLRAANWSKLGSIGHARIVIHGKINDFTRRYS